MAVTDVDPEEILEDDPDVDLAPMDIDEVEDQVQPNEEGDTVEHLCREALESTSTGLLPSGPKGPPGPPGSCLKQEEASHLVCTEPGKASAQEEPWYQAGYCG